MLLRKVFYGICILVDIIGVCFFGGAIFFGIATGKYMAISVAFLATTALFTAISVISLRKSINNKEGKLVRNSALMKLSVFFTCTSFSFWTFDDSTAAFLLFLILGLILSAITIYVIKKKKKKKKKHTVMTVPYQKYAFTYKGKWEWDAAANEYMRLNGIADIDSLTEEQSDKLYEYAAGPFSYLFYWLAVEGCFCQHFYEDFPCDDFVLQMRNREITPVEALMAMDYYFHSDYLLEGIIPFFRAYYDTEGRFTGRNYYLYDYYDAIGNPDDRYYCVDFSWETLDRLTVKIQERYAQWSKEYCTDSQKEYYYDDEPFAEAIHSALFDADMDAYRDGVKFLGFSDSEAQAYLAKCMDCLDALPEKQIKKLERSLDDTYGGENLEAVSIAKFRPEEIHIFEPQVAGDVVFAVIGEAEFEPEHGISFTVRNGIIIDWGFANDFDDPYSSRNVERYEKMTLLDFESIRTESDAKRYLATGELVKVKLLPDLPGCRSEQEEEYLYLTPRALAEKERFEKYIRNIRAFSAIENLGILYTADYVEGRDKSRLSIVPKTLYISNTEINKWVKISFAVHVWY